MSKRDASTYFDLLAAPPDLQAWFGQEPVTVQELSAAAGMDIEEVYSFVDDLNGQKALGPDSVLFPVNTAWPMGFSWWSGPTLERQRLLPRHELLTGGEAYHSAALFL